MCFIVLQPQAGELRASAAETSAGYDNGSFHDGRLVELFRQSGVWITLGACLNMLNVGMPINFRGLAKPLRNGCRLHAARVAEHLLLVTWQARADFLIMLSGTERGDNARILRLSDLHIREYHNIGPEHDILNEPGVKAVCWVQNEGKGNQVSI